MNKEEYIVAHQTWAENFLKSKTQPMSAKDSELFLNCMMAENQEDFPPEQFKNTLQYKLLSARCKSLGLRLSQAVLTYIATTQGSPGVLVMYANALRHWQHVHGEEVLDMDAFVKIFPMGFLTEKELEKAWDAQKLQGAPNSNLLDATYGDLYV